MTSFTCTPADLPEVAGIDAAIFGGIRSRLLERIHGAGPEYAWRAGGTPIQVLSRTHRPPVRSGWPGAAANTAQTAMALAAAALPNARGKPSSSTPTMTRRRSSPGCGRPASKHSGRSIGCGGLARLRRHRAGAHR